MNSLANYDGVSIQVTPEAPGSSIYRYELRNSGAVTLWNLGVSWRGVMEPLSFGLDDTHMPASMTAEAPVRIARLAPGECVTVVRSSWGSLARYTGPRHLSLLITFSAHEGGAPALGLRARVEIGDGTPPG